MLMNNWDFFQLWFFHIDSRQRDFASVENVVFECWKLVGIMLSSVDYAGNLIGFY